MTINKSILCLLLFLTSLSTAMAQGGGDKAGNGSDDIIAMGTILEVTMNDINRCDFHQALVFEVCDYISRKNFWDITEKEKAIWRTCCD